MSASRFEKEYLPQGSQSSLARIFVNDMLAGHVNCCRWDYDGDQVLWITQLVIHREYSVQRLATALLNAIGDRKDVIFGIISPDLVSFKALLSVFAGNGSQASIIRAFEL